MNYSILLPYFSSHSLYTKVIEIPGYVNLTQTMLGLVKKSLDTSLVYDKIRRLSLSSATRKEYSSTASFIDWIEENNYPRYYGFECTQANPGMLFINHDSFEEDYDCWHEYYSFEIRLYFDAEAAVMARLMFPDMEVRKTAME